MTAPHDADRWRIGHLSADDASAEEPLQPWQTLSTELLVVNRWYSVRKDQVHTHTGDEISYTYIDYPGAVFIVPVTPAGELLLIRQYRYPVLEWCWEVPSGGIEPGEDGEVAAARELAEELGAVSSRLQLVASFFASAGISNARSQVFLARDVTLGRSSREPTELLRVVPVTIAEGLRMAHAGDITDAQSALALLLCEPHFEPAR